MAVISGLTWALTITGLRRESKPRPGSEAAGITAHDAGAAAVIAGNLIAFAVCLPMALPVREVSAVNLASLIYLGIFQVGLAYVFLTRSLKHVPGLEASTLLLVEPVFNPVWTWLVQGERPGVRAAAGGALVIFSTLAGSAWRAKFTTISQLQDTTGG
jgi:DME family drug/metabolite transporter